MSSTSETGGSADEFGENIWLVEELYEKYVVDKNSVDQNWWPTLDKYGAHIGNQTPAAAAPVAAPAAPAAPAEVAAGATGAQPVPQS